MDVLLEAALVRIESPSYSTVSFPYPGLEPHPVLNQSITTASIIAPLLGDKVLVACSRTSDVPLNEFNVHSYKDVDGNTFYSFREQERGTL